MNHRHLAPIWLRSQASAAKVLCLMLAVLCAARVSPAQEIERIEAALIDQEPFDLITLTPEEGGESWKVFPLPFRKMPEFGPSEKLEVRLVRFPERLYEIAPKDIQKIGFYEQRIYDEAVEKMKEKDFATAFQNLSFLRKRYPNIPGLEELRQQFIFQSAIDQYGRGELRQAMSALEELKQTARDFQPSKVETALSNVANSIIEAYEKNGDLTSSKAMLARLERKYGPELPVVAKWDQKFEAMARAKGIEAEKLIAEGNFRKARAIAIDMVGIYPDSDEAKALVNKINNMHPMVRVGVMQRAGSLDPSSLVDWPSRRAGALVYESLFQFLETGSEGGDYKFALGRFQLSDDRQELVLMLNPSLSEKFNSFALAQVLLQRANPEDPEYNPSWAAIMESVAVQGRSNVLVKLRRPNVLPHALMQWSFPENEDAPWSLIGGYKPGDEDGSETSFKIRDRNGDQPVEIVELFYDDPKEAVNDLLRGDVDIIDQLYPADARRLAPDRRLRVGTYALPSTHMLIPISDHEYLANTKFRRALLYAIDRENMLKGELLGSEDSEDGQVISGPFPLGNGRNDPLAYAYDISIQPVDYNPRLARLLLVMTTQELAAKALKQKKTKPELEPIIVGCPDFEFARVAVQAMIQQWSNVGIKGEMLILPPGGISKDAKCDLLYTITTMWEPATDIERLLGGNGIAATDNPFMVQALENLRAARNWREVGRVLKDMHQLIDYHLPMLPLWQVRDRFVVRNSVEGVPDSPVSLYQNISRWQIKF